MREFCEAASTHPKTINAKVRHLVIKAGWFLDKAVHLEQIRALTSALKEMPEETCAVRVFDYPIYKAELEEAQIPHLYLEVEQQMDSFGQAGTRIQSFAEMIG